MRQREEHYPVITPNVVIDSCNTGHLILGYNNNTESGETQNSHLHMLLCNTLFKHLITTQIILILIAVCCDLVLNDGFCEIIMFSNFSSIHY